MALVIFDNEIVESHSLFVQCGSSLSVISEKDYQGKRYFPEGISALDLDAYETKLSKTNNDCTVDAVIGIANYRNKLTNRRLQLIELRLNYKSSDTLSGTKLKGKINHSLSLMGRTIPIDPTVLFIFSENVYFEAQRRINNEGYAKGSSMKWVAISPSEFQQAILFREKIPYIPENDYAKINLDILSLLDSKNWQAYMDSLSHWGRAYFKYLSCYNLNEADLIKGMIIELHQQGAERLVEADSDVQLCFELLEDEIGTILA